MLDNPNADTRVEELENKGRRIPARLIPPDIISGYLVWLDDFFWLGRDRQLSTHGSGQIPAASIERHTSGWPDDEAQMFRRVICALDTVWLKRGSPDGDIPESGNPARDAFRAKR